MSRNAFVNRHIGPDSSDIKKMLSTVGVSSINELIDKTVPSHIRLKQELNLPDAMSENEYLTELKATASKIN